MPYALDELPAMLAKDNPLIRELFSDPLRRKWFIFPALEIRGVGLGVQRLAQGSMGLLVRGLIEEGVYYGVIKSLPATVNTP